ncbi:MAG: T9SS type A sorting domain-containing protein [Flavobacteriales bacterium]|nr:T9SS type A sorting domain-containing protein [Flavobacteriales bacterium]
MYFSIWRLYGELSTDAEPLFIWFLDGQPVDTSSTTLNAMEYGAGSYVVRAFNSSNCTTESDAVLVETGSVGQIARGQLPIEIQGDRVRWSGEGEASLQVYGLDGRLLFSTSIGAEAVQLHVPRSVYILQIRSGGHSGAFRVLMGE